MSSDQLYVIITHTLIPEKRDFYVQEIENKLSLIRQQAGCVQLSIYEDTENPNKIIAYQIWETPEHWRAHLQSTVAKELTALGSSTTTGFTIEKMVLHNI